MEFYARLGMSTLAAALIVISVLHDVLGNSSLKSGSYLRPLRPELMPDSNIPPLQLGGKLPTFADYHPPKKRSKKKKLFKRLGADFDSEWMSIERPEEAMQQIISTEQNLDSSLLKKLHQVNFNLSHSNGSAFFLDQVMLEALQSWMIRRASCPVHFVWIDQGDRWWPRWLKTGVCVDDNPCSWPPGMHCVPAESKVLYLLRWHCRPWTSAKKRWKKFGKNLKKSVDSRSNDFEVSKTDNDKSDSLSKRNTHSDDIFRLMQRSRPKGKLRKDKKRCKWLRVPYPVTAECYCTC